MRLTAIAICCLGLALSACSKSEQASNPAASDLAAAGAEAKAAASDLERVASDEAPQVRQAGAELSQDVKKAGTAIRTAADKAGQDLKASAKKTNDAVVGNHDDNSDND